MPNDEDSTGRFAPTNTVARRRFLRASGATILAAATAGCSGSSDDGDASTPDETTTAGGATTTGGPNTLENQAGNEVGATLDDVEQLAREEGETTFYAVLDTESVEKVIEAFNQRYPDVTVNHVTGGDAKLLSRWETEYKTDNVTADLLTVGVPRIAKVWENGQAMKLSNGNVPSFGALPDKFKGGNGYWLSIRQLLASVFYNTDAVSADAVDSYTDVVTDDRWSDQALGWDPTPDMGMMNWFWNRHDRSFFENLRDQTPRFVDSHTDLARLCGAGEFDICFTYTHKMGRFGDELPLDYFKLDTVPSGLSPTVVNNKAPNPNAAILFLNWLASAEGQSKLGEGQYIPVHPEAEYTGYPGVFPSDEYEVDTFFTSMADVQTMQDRWKEIMGDIT